MYEISLREHSGLVSISRLAWAMIKFSMQSAGDLPPVAPVIAFEKYLGVRLRSFA